MKTRNSEKLTEKVKQFALSRGAAAVGIASVDFWKDAPEGSRPRDTLEDANSVVVFICPLPESIFLAKHRRVWQRVFISTRHLLDQGIALPLTHFIEENGYVAVPITVAVPVEITRPRSGLWGDISHRHAAVGAGLGEIGHSQLLVTSEWGPRVWIASVITNALLIPDTPFQASICNSAGCGEPCVQVCPLHAISKEGIDKRLCASESLKYSTLGFVGLLKDLFAEENPEKRKSLISGLTTLEVHQFLAMGGVAHCVECMRVCPIGKKLLKRP